LLWEQIASWLVTPLVTGFVGSIKTRT